MPPKAVTSKATASASTAPAPDWLKTLLENQERRHTESMQQIQSLLSLHQSQISSFNQSIENQPKEKIVNIQKPSTLNLDVNYSQFMEWRENWNDYALLIKLNTLPEENQRALLRCSMSDEMRTHLKCATISSTSTPGSQQDQAQRLAKQSQRPSKGSKC